MFTHESKRGFKTNQYYSKTPIKPDLTRQIETLEAFCLAKGITIDQVFSDVASGINFEKRKNFFSLLDLVLDGQVEKVFISYKDRLSRVGFSLFKQLFLKLGVP